MHNIDSQIIIQESKIDQYLYYCDKDTYQLFNYYLSEIGLEPNYPAEGITYENSTSYCKVLLDTAKNLGKQQNKNL